MKRGDLPSDGECTATDALSTSIARASAGFRGWFSAGDLLAKARSLCAEVSFADLLTAISVHRASCHLADCPVLAVMEDHAKTRQTGEAPS